MTGSVFLWFAGTSMLVPFLPLYVRELDGIPVARAALWSGMVLACTPAASALCAPGWGALADRFGRKLLLQRSLLGFTVTLGLMGAVQHVWQLVALRAAMGLFGGFSATAVALVSSTAPADRLTRVVGRVQAARLLGMGIGPLPGGLLADTIGMPVTCGLSSVLGVVALVTVTLWSVDDGAPARRAALRAGAPHRPGFPWTGMLGVLAAGCLVRLVERTFSPVLPSLLAGMDRHGMGIATATAVVSTLGLLATMAGAVLVGRVRRRGHARNLCWALLVALAGFLPMAVATSFGQVLALRVLVGLGLGAAITLTFSMVTAATGEPSRGFALGVLGSLTSFGGAAGYLAAGILSTASLATVFVVDSGLVLLALAANALYRPAARGRFADW